VKVCSRSQDLPEDAQSILAWRVDRLRDAGFPAGLAAAVARDRRYDAHALLELTDRGCPAHLAARILCPLDHDPQGGR
jgi:hypothetical protein